MSPADPAVLLREALRKVESRQKFLEARCIALEEKLEAFIIVMTEFVEGQSDDGR